MIAIKVPIRITKIPITKSQRLSSGIILIRLDRVDKEFVIDDSILRFFPHHLKIDEGNILG